MLAINDLHLEISGTKILNGVNLRIGSGETVGIIGPNGSGKTSLFNCISGFAVPHKGEVLLRGAPITKLAPHERAARGIGRVFQNFGVFREMTVRENVVTAIESRQSPIKTFFPWNAVSRENHRCADVFLTQVALTEKAEQKAGSLSGGQMRLLEIIRTLALGADLFLLDEPTAGVSPRMKDHVSRLIGKLQELGKTILVIEHDINFIQKFCQRIVVLDLGQVILDDTPEKVRTNNRLAEIYFGSRDTEAPSTGAGVDGAV